MSDTGSGAAYLDPAPPNGGDFTDEEDRPNYIGVGDNAIVPPSPGLGTTSMWPGGTPANPYPEGITGRLPQYEDGDEWELFDTLSPEAVAGIQEAFQEAGLIPVSATLPYGTWDQQTANAMRQVLSLANASGNNWEYTFRQMARNAPGYLTAEREEQAAAEEARNTPTPLPPFKASNPDDLRAVVQQVARRTIGRKADEAFVNKFVNDWQTYESSRYSNQRWDPDQGQWIDQNTVQSISPDTAAEKAILGDYGDQAGAMGLLKVMDAFESFIARPSV